MIFITASQKPSGKLEEEIYEADVESTQLELDSRSSQEVADDDVEVGSRAQV